MALINCLVNDGNIETLGKYTGGTFDVPVVLGSSPDTTPIRYFKGTLTNVNIEVTDPEYYTVTFNANGGAGTMPDQSIRKDETIALSKSLFEKEDYIFDGWNTASDGTGTDYKEGQSVKNLTKTPNDIVELYAIWSASSYTLSGDYVFTGSNYIDTGVYLFNEKTVNKDFEASFEIVSRGTTTKQATLVSCMDETGSPWPGFVYRINSATEDQLDANTNNSIKVEQNYTSQNITKVSIKRTNHILYISFNDAAYEQKLGMTQLSKTFDVPLTFGSSLNGNGIPQRYFKGTLRNMSVTIIE